MCVIAWACCVSSIGVVGVSIHTYNRRMNEQALVLQVCLYTPTTDVRMSCPRSVDVQVQRGDDVLHRFPFFPGHLLNWFCVHSLVRVCSL